MDFETFIKELKLIPGFEYLTPDKNDVYYLRINHLHLIQFSDSGDHQKIYIYASLYNIPHLDSEKADLFYNLLNANLFGKETGDACFAIDSKSDQVILLVGIPYLLLSKDLFFEKLNQFIGCLAQWKEKAA